MKCIYSIDKKKTQSSNRPTRDKLKKETTRLYELYVNIVVIDIIIIRVGNNLN